MELSFREPVLHLLEQGLLRRLPPPEPVEPHHPAIEVHLRSNQPIQPLAIHFEAVTQQLDLSYRIGSPDVHEPTSRVGLEVQRGSSRPETHLQCDSCQE